MRPRPRCSGGSSRGLDVFLCLVLFTQGTLAAGACAGETAAGADEKLYRRALALVEQLGDEHFATREWASSELIRMGMAGRKALEEGRRHLDREIRYRCERILSIIKEQDFERRLAGFAAGRSGGEFDLPGWARFRQRFGESPEARKLFVLMQKAEPELMEAVEKGAREVTKMIDTRCMTLQQSQRFAPQRIALGSIAALLFAASDQEVRVSFQAGSALCSFCYQPAFKQGMEDATKNRFLGKLLGAWIERADGWIAYQCLSLAMNYNLKEGLVPAVKALENPATQAHIRQNSILVIARLGDESHIPRLESLLDDRSRCATQRINNVTYETQIRDVALAAILLMKKQDPKKFGFDRIQQHPTNVFITSTVGFESDEKRNQAFAKWKEFKSHQNSTGSDLHP